MKLDYGKNGIEINLNSNWNTTIIQPVEQDVIKNPIKAIRDAIRKPLGSISLESIIKTRKTIKSVCIVASDATRPVPTHIILNGLIQELIDYGTQSLESCLLRAEPLYSRKKY